MSPRSRSLSPRRSRGGNGTPSDRVVWSIVALILLFLIFFRVHGSEASPVQQRALLWWIAAVVLVGLVIELAEAAADGRARASSGFWFAQQVVPEGLGSEETRSSFATTTGTYGSALVVVDLVLSAALWKWSRLSPFTVVIATTVGLGLLLWGARPSRAAVKMTGHLVPALRGRRSAVLLTMALVLIVELVRLHIPTSNGGVVSSDLAAVVGVVGSGVVVGLLIASGSLVRQLRLRTRGHSSDQALGIRSTMLEARVLRGIQSAPGFFVSLVLLARGGLVGVVTLFLLQAMTLLGAEFAVQAGSVAGFIAVGLSLGILSDRLARTVVARSSAGTVLVLLRQGATRLQRSMTLTVATIASLVGILATVALGVALRSSSLVIDLGILFIVPATLSAVVGSICMRLVELEDAVVASSRSKRAEFLHRSTLPLYLAVSLLPLVQIRSALESGSDLLSPAISSAFFLLLFPLAGLAWISRREVRRG